MLHAARSQVQALCGLSSGGVPTTYLSSQQSKAERHAVFLELRKAAPTVKLLYITPEQLVKSDRLIAELQGLCARGLLARLIIDEAHCEDWLNGLPLLVGACTSDWPMHKRAMRQKANCRKGRLSFMQTTSIHALCCAGVSMWGHDFRKDYLQIGKTRVSSMLASKTTGMDYVRSLSLTRLRRCFPLQAAHFPSVPCVALTATATAKVQKDLLRLLKMPDARTFTVSFYRPNLLFRVIEKDTKDLDDDGRPFFLQDLISYIR